MDDLDHSRHDHDHDHDHDRDQDHRHAHGHGHDHAHGHDEHHGHAHDPSSVIAPGPSLLRLSALERLAGAAVLSGLIWLGVKWAMA